MKMIISKWSTRKIVMVIVFTMIIVVENLVLWSNNQGDKYDLWLSKVSTAVLINVIITIIIFSFLKVYIISLATFFIMFSYVFHFGQVIIHGFFSTYSFSLNDAIGQYSMSSVYSLLFSLDIIATITLFVIIFSKDINYRTDYGVYNCYDDYRIKLMGYRVLAVTFPIQFYVCLRQYMMSRMYYYGSYDDTNGALFQIGTLSLIGFSLLIFGYSKEKNKKLMVFGLSSAWYVITMLSGSRIYAVISICVLLYCYLRTNEKNSISKYLFYIFLSLIFLALLNTIMRVRTMGTVTIGAVVREFINPSSNMLLGALEEFGGSAYTVKIGFEQIPAVISYNYGLSYIDAVTLVGLNIGGILNSIINNLSFTNLFTIKYSYGGSYIAELYYNFGWISLLIAPFWGMLLVRISDRLNKYVVSKNYFKASYLVMLFYGFLLWIRGYANAMSRGAIWGALLILMVSKTIRRKNCCIHNT